MASNNNDVHGNDASRGTGGQPPARCAADDLKDVLQHITDQIADADRRHTATLRHLQERLATLGEHTEQVRTRVPEEFAPAFERIEDGMAQLARRLAGSPRDWLVEPTSDAAKGDPVDTVPESSFSPSPGMVPDVPAIAATPAPHAAAPAPLRSAVAALASPAHGRGDDMAAPAAKRDPFDFAEESVPNDPAQPWDKDQAEALARIYDQGEAFGIGQKPPAEPARSASFVETAPPVTHPVQIQSAPAWSDAAKPGPAAAGGPLPAADREWLEQKFADIATRVEQSLAGARPDSALQDLDSRFDQLERRLGSALEDVATRSDVEGLRIVEAHISELSTHVENTHAQLARLDGIEVQLGELITRMSEEHLGRLFNVQGPSSAELQNVARVVAEHLGERMPKPAAQAAQGPDRFDEVRRAIESLVHEQRIGGEQTASMLDTMQQAMIRLLDRMDALEHTPAHVIAASAAPAHADHELHVPRADPTDVAMQQRYDEPPQMHRPTDYGAAEARPVALPELAPTVSPAVRQEPQFAGHEPEPDAAAGAPKPRSREDFVAAARRAMQQTASQRQFAAEADAETDAGAGEAPVDVGRGRTARPADEKGSPPARSGKAAGSNKLKPGLLVAAIALLALGGAYTMLRGMRPPVQSAAKLERAEPSAATGLRGKPAETGPEAEAEDKTDGGMQVPGGSQQKQSGDATDVEPAKRAAGALSPTAPASAVQPAPLPSPRPGRAAPAATTDDLSEAPGTEAAAPMPASQDGAFPRSVAEALKGVTVQSASGAPNVNELIRARQHQGMAILSGRVGAAMPSAPVAQAALIAGDPAQTGQSLAAVAHSAGSSVSTPVDLPPAMVGPLSLRLAAGKGDPSAEFEVGARFAEGKGVQQDFKQAVNWYQRAATQGFAPAQYRLATLFERGLGVKQDAGRAKSWYKRAAEQGNIKAMHNLAVLSAGRDMASPDYASAAQWFNEAAERGLADSQFNLGVLYENGLGVEKDMRQAYKWLSLAARGGDKEAARRKEALFARLGPAEQKAAAELLETWKPKPADIMANDARAAGEAWKGRTPAQQPG